MSIKSQGGVFGRNPTFNDVTVEGDLSIAGTLSVGGETITGLSYQGGWNANTNTPDIAASSPVTGQFWIVSTDGSTDVGGITNWTSGDWALYDGTNWQRVEGGNTDLSTGVSGQLAVANGGTGAADAATARTNLGLGTAATTAATDYATSAQGSLADSALQPADIGSTVQGYDANILTSSDIGSTVQGYDATILTSSDIGSTVQGYDADTAKLDAAQTFTATQSFNNTISSVGIDLRNDAAADRSVLSLLNNEPNSAASVSQTFYLAQNSGAVKTAAIIRADKDNTWGSNTSTDGALIFYVIENNTMYDVVKMDGNGNLNVNYGNVVIGTSGKGIDFSATSGTGTSELLDDYEEGAWTPTGFTGTINNATYVKVGRLVTVQAYIHTATFSSYIIGGLPFAASAGFAAGAIGYNDSTNVDGIYVLSASTNLGTVSGATVVTPNGSQIIFTASYQTAS